MEESENNSNHAEKTSVGDRSYRSNRSDVVSFTFTTPITRPVISNSGFQPNNQIKNTPDSTNNVSNAPSLAYNVIGTDALSTLLDQKLRELTGSPESVSQGSLLATATEVRDDLSYGFSSYNPDQDQDRITRNDSSYGFSTNVPLELMKKHHNLDSGRDLISKDESSYGFSSTDPPEPLFRDYEYRKYLFGRQPSPNSVLEPSITESCNSSYNTTDSCKQNLTSVQAQELIAASLSTNPSPMDVDTELLDSASSTTTVTKWEPEYVKQVLANIESMFVDFTIGKTRKLVDPRVFDRLELGKPTDEVAKLRRELMFNCVSECMETRCRVWAKGLATVRRPDRLAQEVYQEIAGWEDMKDSMVDELVDTDMSGNGYKKWLDFEVEVFEIGVEIELRLLDSLINEIVDDILVL